MVSVKENLDQRRKEDAQGLDQNLEDAK